MVLKFKNSFINIKNEEEYLNKIDSGLHDYQIRTFFYLNSYSFYLANKNKDFNKALNESNYIIADGYSIVVLARLIYKHNIKKVVFTYLFYKKISIFLRENKSAGNGFESLTYFLGKIS